MGRRCLTRVRMPRSPGGPGSGRSSLTSRQLRVPSGKKSPWTRIETEWQGHCSPANGKLKATQCDHWPGPGPARRLQARRSDPPAAGSRRASLGLRGVAGPVTHPGVPGRALGGGSRLRISPRRPTCWSVRALRVHYEVWHGDPSQTIVNAADRGLVDLIAMTTHGWRGLDRLRFGSVAESVVRKARVPVLRDYVPMDRRG
jgi:Universal stress protein family